MTSSTLPRIIISVVETPSGFRADAVLTSGTHVTIVRESRELAIRECAEKVRELEPEPVTVTLPFCAPEWSLPWWHLPKFRQYDPERSDDDAPPLAAVRHGQDGTVPLELTDMPGMGDA